VGSGEFLNINFFTALFTLANTVALFLVLKKYLFKPVLKMIETRQKEIDDLYADAGNAKQQAQLLEAEYRQKLDAAAETGDRLVKEATVRAQNRSEQIVAAANAEADAIRAKAAADIAQEKKKALNDAKDEISVLALDIAGKVVGRELTAADSARLVDSFIDGLGEG
jgi:F-type H+-transporting ATPase subunit b